MRATPRLGFLPCVILSMYSDERTYLVVSRERNRNFEEDQSVAVVTTSDKTVRIQRLVSEDGAFWRAAREGNCHDPSSLQKNL